MLAVPSVDARQRVSFQLTLTNVSSAELSDIAVARVEQRARHEETARAEKARPGA